MSDGRTRATQGRPANPFDHHASTSSADPWSTCRTLGEDCPTDAIGIVDGIVGEPASFLRAWVAAA